MATKKTAKKSHKRSDIYSVDEQGKTTTTHRYCPHCNPGIFMGEHKDRFACGKCGYTEFKQ